MLYSEKFKKAEDALAFYAYARTKNNKGVTIPSQIRYIHYFEKFLKQGWDSKKEADKGITYLIFSYITSAIF